MGVISWEKYIIYNSNTVSDRKVSETEVVFAMWENGGLLYFLVSFAVNDMPHEVFKLWNV